MSDLFEESDHATPLTPEERRELIPAHIAYRSELNEAEQENIVRAQDWALGRRRDLLNEKFINDLHRHMLGDVWRWAGKFRTSERNLGIAYYEIPAAVRQLLDDTKTWIKLKAYPPDEIAVRFHHRLVLVVGGMELEDGQELRHYAPVMVALRAPHDRVDFLPIGAARGAVLFDEVSKGLLNDHGIDDFVHLPLGVVEGRLRHLKE